MISLKLHALHCAAANGNGSSRIGTGLGRELIGNGLYHVDELYHAVEHLVDLRAGGKHSALDVGLTFALGDLLIPLGARLQLLIDGLEEKLAQDLDKMLGIFHVRILKPGLAQRLDRKRRRFRRDLGRNVAEPHAPVLLRDIGSEVPDRFIGIKVDVQAADINFFVHILTLLLKAMPNMSAAHTPVVPTAALSIYC